MRSALLAFMLCVSSTVSLARNGETGILIALPEFELEHSAVQDRDVVKICDREWEMIQKLLANGYPTHIFLKGLGAYTVELSEDGFVHIIQDSGDEKLLTRQDCDLEDATASSCQPI